MSWTDAELHIIDFEGSLASGVLEYGIVSWRDGEIRDVRTRFCGPEGPVRESEAVRHGIRPEAASAFPPFRTDWAVFRAKRETGPFAAHFASTEKSLLKDVWPYPGRMPDFSGARSESVEWGPWVDTGRLIPRLFDPVPGAGLEQLIETFFLQDRLDEWGRRYCPANRLGYHCALYDALASTLLLEKTAEIPAFRNRSLRWLFEMSAGRDADTFRQGRLL